MEMISINTTYSVVVGDQEIELLPLSNENVNKLKQLLDCIEDLGCSMYEPITIGTYYGLFDVTYYYGDIMFRVVINQPFCKNEVKGGSFQITPYKYLNYLYDVLPTLEKEHSNENCRSVK